MRSFTWTIALCVLCPVDASAQAPKAKVAFGQNGYVTKDELAKLEYGPVVKDLALSTHVPRPRVLAGEPLWAYFVVKNSSKETQGLDMRFDFVTGQTHLTINSGSFSVKPLSEGAKHGMMGDMHLWACGGGPLVDVAGKGYYVAGLDLAAWGKLGPGDYAVSWRYMGQSSNTVRVTVAAGDERPQPKEKHRHWNLWELDHRPPALKAGKQERETWNPTKVRPWWQRDLSAALGSGVGDRHVTDLERLPASDDLLSVAAEWKLGDKVDQVTLRFSARDPKVRVGLDKLHVYLLADVPEVRGTYNSRASERRAVRITPHTIELHLPVEWRTRLKEAKVEETFQAALLVTSEPLRAPVRNQIAIGTRTQELMVERTREEKADRTWDGLLRTSYQNVTWR